MVLPQYMTSNPYFTNAAYYPTSHGMRGPSATALPTAVPLSEANRNFQMQHIIQEMKKVSVQESTPRLAGFDHLQRQKEEQAQRKNLNSKIDEKLGDFMTRLS